jgi:hypothetical protein
MPAKKNKIDPDTLEGEALFKEACRRIRVARSLWKAHRNKPCRAEREKALALYERLTIVQKKRVPEELQTWLNYRSEKYFGKNRKGNGANSKE